MFRAEVAIGTGGRLDCDRQPYRPSGREPAGLDRSSATVPDVPPIVPLTAWSVYEGPDARAPASPYGANT
jgi:hypothetical protein